jgi:hypothetical protein
MSLEDREGLSWPVTQAEVDELFLTPPSQFIDARKKWRLTGGAEGVDVGHVSGNELVKHVKSCTPSNEGLACVWLTVRLT